MSACHSHAVLPAVAANLCRRLPAAVRGPQQLEPAPSNPPATRRLEVAGTGSSGRASWPQRDGWMFGGPHLVSWTAVAERSGDTALAFRGAVPARRKGDTPVPDQPTGADLWHRGQECPPHDCCAGRQSGVALRFPPQSKTARVIEGSLRRGVTPFRSAIHRIVRRSFSELE